MLSVKIINDGSLNIKEDDFSQNIPFGLAISSGIIIGEPELTGYSDEFINQQMKITKDSQRNIHFSKIMLDKDNYFIINLLILNNRDTIPEIKPLGKLSGSPTIKIYNIAEKEKEKNRNIFVQIFKGNFVIQILRIILYSLILILIILSFVGIYQSIKKLFFPEPYRPPLGAWMADIQGRYSDKINQIYNNEGIDVLNKIYSFLKLGEENLTTKYNELKAKEAVLDPGSPEFDDWGIINKMINSGLIYLNRSTNEISYPPPLIDLLKDKIFRYYSNFNSYDKPHVNF